MLARLSGVALAIVCALAPVQARGADPVETRPAVTFAMMSAMDVLRAIRCALPSQCRPVPPKKKQRRKQESDRE